MLVTLCYRVLPLPLQLTNLLAMMDSFNTLLTSDPAVPAASYPANNANILSVLHNNRWVDIDIQYLLTSDKTCEPRLMML